MLSENPIRWTNPGTWPWFVYFWLAASAAGWVKPIWRWIQRQRASRWPPTQGRIEYVSVDRQKRFCISSVTRSRSSKYVAELGYAYSVAGNSYAGIYTREFGAEEEAREFVRALNGGGIAIAYNPNKPSASMLSEPSLETLLRTRPPALAGISPPPTSKSIPIWLRPFIWIFVAISAVGLSFSLYVHLGAVMGRHVAPGSFFWALHMGIFVVWIPAVLVAQRRVGSTRRQDFWKVVLKDSPEWMRYMVYVFFGYALLNFTIFFFNSPTGRSEGNPSTTVWRGFSGHWMAFYSAALAILYSSTQGNASGLRCVNNHPVPSGANFCQRCGAPVTHNE